MRIVRTVRELREALAAARSGGARSVGFVPTMGALHEGHLSLVRAARADNDAVVLSIFVNPKQFDEAADLDAYPRQERQDAELAERAGIDLIFAPSAEELYPAGFATTVSVGGPVARTLEGAERGAVHFEGVATVVSKLLIAVAPERAYFGRKDAQQLAVVRRMVADLGLPTEIVGCPTSREEDGLARSSRNVRLDAEARARAAAIPRSLEAAESGLAAGERRSAALCAAVEAVLAEHGVAAEYIAFVDPDSFEVVDNIDRAVLCAVAARVGGVRLIDNLTLHPTNREHGE